MDETAHANPLRRLYAVALPSKRAWPDSSDNGYIATHLIERSIAALAPFLEGPLLDVGCGRQPYRAYFTHLSQIVACDYDARRGDVDFTCPADRIPVADECYKAILSTEVLEHVPDPAAVWREFFRVLQPGGTVLLSTPMYWPAHEEPFDYYRFPRAGLRSLAEAAGFAVEEVLPRGGSWAFLGQVGMHVFGHQLRWRWLIRCYNEFFLRFDRSRCNSGLSLGWTILARKRGSATLAKKPLHAATSVAH